MSSSLLHEEEKNRAVCTECNGDKFKVYITIIIDDARLYCTNCGTPWVGYAVGRVDSKEIKEP